MVLRKMALMTAGHAHGIPRTRDLSMAFLAVALLRHSHSAEQRSWQVRLRPFTSPWLACRTEPPPSLRNASEPGPSPTAPAARAGITDQLSAKFSGTPGSPGHMSVRCTREILNTGLHFIVLHPCQASPAHHLQPELTPGPCFVPACPQASPCHLTRSWSSRSPGTGAFPSVPALLSTVASYLQDGAPCPQRVRTPSPHAPVP